MAAAVATPDEKDHDVGDDDRDHVHDVGDPVRERFLDRERGEPAVFPQGESQHVTSPRPRGRAFPRTRS